MRAATGAPSALPSAGGGGVSGKVNQAKRKILRHVLWIWKGGLAWICGATMAATFIGGFIQWLAELPVNGIFWGVNQFHYIGYPTATVLAVVVALMGFWIIVGTCWDWECDKAEIVCLLLVCSIGLGAAGVPGDFAGWMADRGNDLGQATLGKLLGA